MNLKLKKKKKTAEKRERKNNNHIDSQRTEALFLLSFILCL